MEIISESDLSELWEGWISERNLETRNKLFNHFQSWLLSQTKIAYRKYGFSGLELADYLHWGAIGLLESIERFDPSKGRSFEAFAFLRVRGEILSNLSRISESSAIGKERKKRVEERIDSILKQYDSASFDELLEFVGVLAQGEIIEEALYHHAEEEKSNYGLGDHLLYGCIGKAIDALETTERDVINYHYRAQLAFTEIADILQLSKGRVSQIHASALQSLEIYFSKNNVLLE